MLAEWREFEHLRRQPWNPSVAIILYRDGRTITEAKSELSDAHSPGFDSTAFCKPTALKPRCRCSIDRCVPSPERAKNAPFMPVYSICTPQSDTARSALGGIVNKGVNELERVSVQLAELDKTLAKQSLKSHELSG
ncbi:MULTISPECIES: hypothetical protein [unclassified Mesorhizobium]|uniref:hypothetical protein n=1 Tax=unclassified Mesorhizobium TaxID=325217 RepID=UPI0013E01BE3|nr:MULTISPECIES: hypothetical protein [unclassified Mesorhizobium]